MSWPQLTKTELLARQAQIESAKPKSNRVESRYHTKGVNTPEIKCKNAHKDRFSHCCDYYTRRGFSTCQGCADSSRGVD